MTPRKQDSPDVKMRFARRLRPGWPAYLALAAGLICPSMTGYPDSIPGFDEIWRKSQSLRPDPSMDTTVVAVTNGAVTYDIPRNYIFQSDPVLPTLRVTYPGFLPLREDTRACFDRKNDPSRSGCTTFQLILGGGKGPPFSNAERFRNFLHGMKAGPANGPANGPYGYKIYAFGPDNARTELFRKDDGDVYFGCFIQENLENGGVIGSCDDMFFLPDGHSVRFFFGYDQIKDVEAIEAGTRKLMSGFIRKGAPK
jgi:hypothetical protein